MVGVATFAIRLMLASFKRLCCSIVIVVLIIIVVIAEGKTLVTILY